LAEIADQPPASSRNFTCEHGGEQVMSTRQKSLATTAGWLVAVTACSVASVTAWLLVTAPTTVAMAVQGRDVQPLAQFALRAIYEAVTRLVRYL
jgi:hypothetical protein